MNVRRRMTTERPRERAVLVALATRARHSLDPDIALDELAGLARAAGADVVLRVVQERGSPDPATLIGKGKAELLARGAEETGATVVIVDNEITPGQARNLEKVCGRRIVDRTELSRRITARSAAVFAVRMAHCARRITLTADGAVPRGTRRGSRDRLRSSRAPGPAA